MWWQLRNNNASGLLNLIVILIAASFIGCDRIDLRHQLSTSVSWLWSQQAPDGAWHSETHGIMKSGRSLTPFILWHLLQIPDEIFAADPADAARGIAFVRRDVQLALSAGELPDVVDYPNYTLTYALRLLTDYGERSDSTLIIGIVNHLVGQQFVEKRGISRNHMAYGGWGFGESHLRFGEAGHVDLSHTRRVLQSLRPHLDDTDPVFVKASIFLKRLQNLESRGDTVQAWRDGGFFPSLYTTSTNKSAAVTSDTLRWHSYATATCDGLMGLLALPQTMHGVRVGQALRWLNVNDRLDYPAGIATDNPMQWHLVMRLYHLWVRAEVNQAFGISEPEIFLHLEKFRRRDGSYANPMGAPNKEDDPLLATTFAIAAMVWNTTEDFQIDNRPVTQDVQ